MGKNLPLYELIDKLEQEENFNACEVGKIFVGSILEIPRQYLVSKFYFVSDQIKTKKKRQFISSLKQNMQDKAVHQKYIGMSPENILVLFDSRSIRDNRESIEGVVYKILSKKEVFGEDVFSDISLLVYTGSKEYSLQGPVKRKGQGSFKDREYNEILESLWDYVDNNC